MNARRGYVPEDEKFFSAEAIIALRKAASHVFYLINEGYDLKQATVFVGNHFLISERQRLAIMRSLATKEQLENRENKRIEIADLTGREIWIDGFNTIITLEVMQAESFLYEGMDGCIRDLAALRGTYRVIEETESAVQTLMQFIKSSDISVAHILLDRPVSNCGRLKALLEKAGEELQCNVDVCITDDVDRILYTKENVITTDSVILDYCKSWINFAAECVKNNAYEVIRLWQ